MNTIFAYVKVTCAHCWKTSDQEIQVESPSDYYPQDECEHCGKQVFITKNQELAFYKEIEEVATDAWVGQADYLEDR